MHQLNTSCTSKANLVSCYSCPFCVIANHLIHFCFSFFVRNASHSKQFLFFFFHATSSSWDVLSEHSYKTTILSCTSSPYSRLIPPAMSNVSNDMKAAHQMVYWDYKQAAPCLCLYMPMNVPILN